MPLARNQLLAAGIPSESLVFIDDHSSASDVNGHRVVSYSEFLAIPAQSRNVALAIASDSVREELYLKLGDDGVAQWSIHASNAVVLDEVAIAEGAILCPFVTITSNIRIGRCFHANIYSYVAHDCEIGDFVTFAPGVMCNGNVRIEDHVYIGTGAVLKQGRPGEPLVIGRGAVVGMGAVVTRSVAAGTTVVGNPARPLLK